MIRCLHCGAETSNGLALCELCRVAVLKCLEFIPVYFRNLARWKPGRAGSRPVPGSRIPQGVLPAGEDRITRMLDETLNELLTWARCLIDDRSGIELPDCDTEAETIAALSELMSANIVSASTLDWVGQFVTDMQHRERQLLSITERIVPGWYAGACKMCTADTFVIPGLTWVTCGACGTTTAARDHLPVILGEARPWVARPMRLAETIVALVDTEQSVTRLYERIKKWEQREKLEGLRALDADGDTVGPKRYRLGDVLDLVYGEGATRTDIQIARDVAAAS